MCIGQERGSGSAVLMNRSRSLFIGGIREKVSRSRMAAQAARESD